MTQIACTGSDADSTTNPIASSLTTVAEDACVATSLSTAGATFEDDDGFNPLSDTWQQSIQTSTAASGADWTEVFEESLHVVGVTNPVVRYQLTQADVNAGYVRSCIFYTDRAGTETANSGTAEGGTATDATTRASTASLCSAAIPVTNENDAPDGMPVWTLAGSTDAHTGNLVEDMSYSFTATAVTDEDGFDLATAEFSFQRGATVSGTTTWTEAQRSTPSAPMATYTITQADVDAGMMRVCMFYTDEQGTAEGGPDTNGSTLCTREASVDNVNDDPTGMPWLALAARIGNAIVPDSSGNPPSALDQKQTVISVISTGGAVVAGTTGPVLDEDGVPMPGPGTSARMRLAQSIQSSDTASGPWSEVHFSLGDAYRDMLYNISQDAANAGYLRTCIFYLDNYDRLEGIPGKTSATDLETDVTPEERLAGSLCSTPLAVSNANDAPMAVANTVNVFFTRDADDPHVFMADDFPFTDEEDGDSLVSITIASLPAAGTLAVSGTALTSGNLATHGTIAMADIDDLQYYPADGVTQDAAMAYTTFTFNVTDDGDGPGGDTTADRTSTNNAVLTIDLIPPGPITATGMPAVTAATGTAYDENVELTATLGTVVDPNGIDMDTLQWQWRQFDAASGRYLPIAGATEATFTPDEAHGGAFILVCVMFMDEHVNADTGAADPRAEGGTSDVPTLCSDSGRVAQVNDAPTSADATVNVVAGTTTEEAPFAFTAAHFAYADEEGADLASITIVTAPTAGTLRSGDPLAAVTNDTTIMPDAIASLRWHPTAGDTAAQGYATFTFTVNDGNSDSTPANTITINLVPADQTAATGAPTVAAATGTAYDEDVELTASTSGITEPNIHGHQHPELAVAVRRGR